jgi:L-fuculose-phosphate aldolase
MKAQPKARAVSHAHPPHATGFAVAGVTPPTCMIPEIEVFIGRVPIASYETPGTPEMGRKVAELVGEHNTVLMENHGVVSWSHTIEDAYFKMEIVEAYCRTVLVTTQLGVQPKQFSPKHLQDLLNIKKTLGIPDPRFGLKECELCDNDEWRPGVSCAVPASGGNANSTPTDPQAETVVQAVTAEIMNRLKG